MRKILLTGALGRIGRAFFEASIDQYEFILTDICSPEIVVKKPNSFVIADLSIAGKAEQLVDGVDAVVHLAGIPDPNALFDDLLANNILATTYLLDAAASAGCGRFVFASSAQTVEGYPVDRQISTDMPVRPANLYGVSKCYGEALCAYHSVNSNMSTVCLRIGAYEDPETPVLETPRDLSAWISPSDACHLIHRAIEATIDKPFIGFGISNNRFKRFDLTETCKVLGYCPKDDAFDTFNVWSDVFPVHPVRK